MSPYWSILLAMSRNKKQTGAGGEDNKSWDWQETDKYAKFHAFILPNVFITMHDQVVSISYRTN